MDGARQLLLTASILLVCNSGLRAQSRFETAWPDSSAPPMVQTQSRIEWVGSWAEAQALAARHQRLVLIHFWSPDCTPCLKLERAVFNQPECIRALGTNYVPWKVNVAENPTVARDLRVERWPTDVILSASGQELYRGASPLDVNQYTATLDQVAAHARLNLPTGIGSGPGAGQSGTAAQWQSGQNATFPNAALPNTTFPTTPNNANPASSFPAGAPAYQSANTVYGPPAQADNVTVPPATPPVAAAPQSPAYVTNQWVTPESPAAQEPIAEQRASFTTSYGGQFQPPTVSAPNAPAGGAASQWPAAPPSPGAGAQTANTAIPGPLASDMTATPPAAAAPGLNPPALGPPTNVEPPPAAPAADVAVVGLDGYCPVTLVEQEKWVKGDPKWGARHRGRLYFFVGPEQQQRFLEAHSKYAPALSGYDPVKYSDQGMLVDGKRAHGVFYRSQIYLFADEAALQQFWAAPDRYAASVRAEQERSAMRSREVQR